MGPRSGIRVGRRRLLLGALAAAATAATPAVLGGCGVAEPAVGQFEPKGRPMDLPTVPGPTEATLAEIEAMLVGLEGRPVIVNMWASWCVPCRAETPILERAFQANSDEVTFVGVASRDRLSEARAFMDEFDVGYVNLFDTENALPSRWQSRGFPTTVALGRDGRVTASTYGGLTEQRLAAMIQSARA